MSAYYRLFHKLGNNFITLDLVNFIFSKDFIIFFSIHLNCA